VLPPSGLITGLFFFMTGAFFIIGGAFTSSSDRSMTADSVLCLGYWSLTAYYVFTAIAYDAWLGT